MGSLPSLRTQPPETVILSEGACSITALAVAEGPRYGSHHPRRLNPSASAPRIPRPKGSRTSGRHEHRRGPSTAFVARARRTPLRMTEDARQVHTIGLQLWLSNASPNRSSSFPSGVRSRIIASVSGSLCFRSSAKSPSIVAANSRSSTARFTSSFSANDR